MPGQDLKALATSQMKTSEKLVAGGKERLVQRLLAPGETVDHLFGAQINGKQALVALTDRRLLAVYGAFGKSDTVDYSAVGQIDTGLTKVVITGPGVRLVLRAVARRDELVNAVRAHQTKADPFPVPVLACDDPASLLAKLAALHSTGVLSDEEFAAKKAELLARM